MRVAIAHNLPREEVRRRVHERSGEITDFVPGGLATVETSWPSDDRMDLSIIAMGQTVTGAVTLEDGEMVVSFDLPPQLGFFGSMIEQKIREKGQKLLA